MLNPPKTQNPGLNNGGSSPKSTLSLLESTARSKHQSYHPDLYSMEYALKSGPQCNVMIVVTKIVLRKPQTKYEGYNLNGLAQLVLTKWCF